VFPVFFGDIFMFLISIKRRIAILSKFQSIVGDAKNASTRIICVATRENFERLAFFLAYPI